MSNPFLLLARQKKYERSSKSRERLEKRFHEAAEGIRLASDSDGTRKLAPGLNGPDNDNDAAKDARSVNNSKSKIRDDRSAGLSNQEERQSDSPLLSTPRSSLVRPDAATTAIPRRVCFDNDTDSKRSARGLSSPASSISVSQSPIKPSRNKTARASMKQVSDSQQSSIDDIVNRLLEKYDDSGNPKEVQDWIDKDERAQKPDEMGGESREYISATLPAQDLHVEDDDDDEEEDPEMEAWAAQLKAIADADRQNQEKQLKRAIEKNTLSSKATEDAPESSSLNNDDNNSTCAPQKTDDADDNTSITGKTKPGAEGGNHPTDEERVRVVRCAPKKDLFEDTSDEDEIAVKPLPAELKEKRKRKKQLKSKDTDWRQSSTFIQEERLRVTEDRKALELKLKPDFTHPKFGPFDMAPIILQHSEGGESYTVPASIARYLPPYQRQGIEFLHTALSAGTGAVLGDDMGLGKTVQIIGLLTALLAKSGTGLDTLELQRRRQLVAKAKEEFKRKRDDALINGTAIPDESSIVKSLSLPAWAPVLLVVPTGVIQNWLNEFNVWGNFGVALYRGVTKSSSLEEIETGAAEILLCGNRAFQNADDSKRLNRINWKLIIIDELHDFKNGDSLISQHLRAIQTTHRNMRVIGMTGTLMQNQHKELWNLIDLVQPGFLGTWKEFDAKVAKPIRNKMSKTASVEEKGEIDPKGEFTQKLSRLFLKRSKEIISDKLPKKEEFVVFCELSPLQKRIYERILSLPDFALLKKAHAPCDCGVNQRFFEEYRKLRSKAERVHYQRAHKSEIVLMKDCCYSTPINRRRNGESYIDPRAVLWRYHSTHEGDEGCQKCPYCILLPALTKLSSVSSHAALLQIDRPLRKCEGTSSYASTLKDLEFAKVSIPPEDLIHFPGGSYVREGSIMNDHFMLSGKMKMLDELLKKHSAAGKRVLIFSPSTKSLDLIENFVKANGYTSLRMDGSVQQSKRQALIDEYQTNPNIFIFLLSTRATGVGINLTAANVVIIFDCDWNPSADAQAQDRAFRIGQVNDVQVFRLVSRGTIDELKYIRQIYKEQLKIDTIGDPDESAPKIFRGVQGDKEKKGELFGCENLLKYQDASFMKTHWKANDVKLSKASMGMGIAVHSEAAFVNALREKTIEDVIKYGDDRFESFERVANQFVKSNLDDQTMAAVESNLPESGKEEALPVDADAVHEHGDFFREDRGGAALKPGDEGYDEEMGGESQIFFEVCEKAGGIYRSEEPEPEPMFTQDVVSGPAPILASSPTITSMQSLRPDVDLKIESVDKLAPILVDPVASLPKVNWPDHCVSKSKAKPSPLKSTLGIIETAVPSSAYPSPVTSRNSSVKSSVAKVSGSPAQATDGRDRVIAGLQASKRPGTLHQIELPAYLKRTKKSKPNNQG